jgi:hypothetical protein
MRAPLRIPLVLIAPLVLFACGLGASQSVGTGPAPDAGHSDDAGLPCGNEVPDLGCTGPCGVGVVSVVCTEGLWVCPPESAIPCPSPQPDASGGCTFPTPYLGCTDACTDTPESPICIEGTWQCPSALEGVCAGDGGTDAPFDWPDGGDPDAYVAPEAGPRLFACGALACDGDTEECRLDVGGPPLADGGSYVVTNCVPLPSTCAGGAPTCGCMQGSLGGACSCIDTNNDVVVTCEGQ